ncbi:hypothetical protein C8R44DRAFT_737155 [Mycena epipterygia]|nr:hypothetical protein C8R44DRAFT_737155 [Mycena epipterygia]
MQSSQWGDRDVRADNRTPRKRQNSKIPATCATTFYDLASLKSSALICKNWATVFDGRVWIECICPVRAAVESDSQIAAEDEEHAAQENIKKKCKVFAKDVKTASQGVHLGRAWAQTERQSDRSRQGALTKRALDAREQTQGLGLRNLDDAGQ